MSKPGWVTSLVPLVAILFAATALLAQEVVKTKDGRQVLLKPDGTWVYITEEPPQGAVTPAVAPATKSSVVVAPNSAGMGTAPPNGFNTDKQKSASPTPQPGNVDTGRTTPTGKAIYRGPRGGCYHYSKSGKKVYGSCS